MTVARYERVHAYIHTAYDIKQLEFQAQTLAKLALLHNPQTGVYETTNPCAHSDESSPLMQTRCDNGD